MHQQKTWQAQSLYFLILFSVFLGNYIMSRLHDSLKERCKMSMEPTGKRDSIAYSKKMVEAKDELGQLQAELNNVLVKFCLRALRVFQSTRPEPLRPGEIALIVNNELVKGVLYELNLQPSIDAIAKAAKEEWAKEQKQ
jgi:hypothetical protein